MKKLGRSFYLDPNVVHAAKALIGKHLITDIDGCRTGGIITETEAYAGVTDRASHAFNNRRTARTEIMYRQGGTAYVYLCYGVHALFNVVTNVEGIPHAVLIRSIEPTLGIDVMMHRRKITNPSTRLSTGPGSLARALAISTSHSGVDLTRGPITICDSGITPGSSSIECAPRIGVEYAGTDALKPWRFLLANSNWVSHPPRKSH